MAQKQDNQEEHVEQNKSQEELEEQDVKGVPHLDFLPQKEIMEMEAVLRGSQQKHNYFEDNHQNKNTDEFNESLHTFSDLMKWNDEELEIESKNQSEDELKTENEFKPQLIRAIKKRGQSSRTKCYRNMKSDNEIFEPPFHSHVTDIQYIRELWSPNYGRTQEIKKYSAEQALRPPRRKRYRNQSNDRFVLFDIGFNII